MVTLTLLVLRFFVAKIKATRLLYQLLIRSRFVAFEFFFYKNNALYDIVRKQII